MIREPMGRQLLMTIAVADNENNSYLYQLVMNQKEYKNICLQENKKNIARVRNCPDITILNSLSGLLVVFSNGLFVVFLSLCLFVFLSFCFFVFLSFCPFVFLSFVFLSFLSRHHPDQMSEGSQVSKVTLCVKILKWQSVSESVSQ